MTRTPSDDWQSLTSPAEWYSLRYPPDWQHDEMDGILQLTPPEGQGVLTLSCLWINEPDNADLSSVVHLDQLFPRRRNVEWIEPLEVPYPSVAIEGEAQFDEQSNWWKRLLRPRNWQRWRIWVVRQKSVCLVATFLQTEGQDSQMLQTAIAILQTLVFAEEPAAPPDLFAARVLELARRKFPLLKCEPGGDFQVLLGESKINLMNFYRAYVKAPDRFDEIVLPALTTVVQVQEWGDDQHEPPLREVRDRIMPMLYPEAAWQENFPDFVSTPWIAELMILYVVDEAQAYWYIRDELLQKWGLDRDELHELALRNLDDYFEQHAMEFSLVGEEDGPKILLPNRPDAYNTARLLSSAFHQKMRELLGREFAVGVPSRDFFVAVSLQSQQTIEHIRQKVIEDYATMGHPLTERLLLISADGVSEYCEENPA